MEPLENKVYQRMQDARMNKYYHQTSERYFRLAIDLSNLISLSALIAAGSNVQWNFQIPFLVYWIGGAGFISFALIVLQFSRQVVLHEYLFQGFNNLDLEYTILNDRFEQGNEAKASWTDFETLEIKFRNLEAKQRHPFRLLIMYSDGRVRAELGEMKQWWPLPYFREIKDSPSLPS